MRARWLRRCRTLHAWAALVCGVGVAAYAASGFLIVHGDRLEAKRPAQIEPFGVQPGLVPAVAGAELEARLREHFGSSHGAGGKLERHDQRADGSHFFRFFRPSRTVDVDLRPDGGGEIRVEGRGPVHGIGYLHKTHRYEGPLAKRLWALGVDVTASALIVFVLSGIGMWGLARPGLVGGVALALGLLYPLATILYLGLRS